jgi:catechol 2,3-dioxygenase-like lactoylglutathione lyase family enzyme
MNPHLYRVILQVDDIARADAFWSSLLALEMDPVTPGRHYFHTGGAILALVDPTEHAGPHRANPDWTCFRVPDLDATWGCAEALGAPDPPAAEGRGIRERVWGERSFYTFDPAGNPICFVDDASSEAPSAQAGYLGRSTANLYKAILPTRSLARSGAFFEELLGLAVDTSVPNRHFLYCRGCILALVDPTEHDRSHERAPRAFAPNPDCVYFGVGDLDATFERTAKLGMAPIPGDWPGQGIAVRPWGERSFYGLDPSGNPICFVDDETLFTGSAPRPADPAPPPPQ